MLKVIWTGCRTLAPMWVGAKATARVPRRVLWIAVNLVQPATRAPLSAHAVITRHPRVDRSTAENCQPENYRDDCCLAERPPSKATHPHLHPHHTRYDLRYDFTCQLTH